jgi:hypothetical protein
MTIVQTGWEGGTNGATVTTSAGGLGDPFGAITPTGMVFSNAQHAHGSLSALISNPGTNQVVGRWTVSGSRVAARLYVYLTTLPSGDCDLIQIDCAGGTSAIFRINSLGAARLVGFGNVFLATNTGVAFPINTWVRCELDIQAGTSSTTGQAHIAYYPLDSATATWDPGNITGINTAAANAAFTNVRVGHYNSTSYTGDIYIDDARVHTGVDATGFVGPVATSAPSVSVSSNSSSVAKAIPGASVPLTAVATDPAGGTISYSWTYQWPASGAPTINNSTTANASITAGADGDIYNIKCTVTSSVSGLTGTANLNCQVASATTGGAAPDLVWDGSTWR